MKKLLIIAMLCISGTVFAQHHHGHSHGHGYWRHSGGSNWGWVAPALIGGVIVYEATRPPVVIQQPAPYVIQQPPVTQQVCSPWTEIRNPDGTVTYTRTCNQ